LRNVARRNQEAQSNRIKMAFPVKPLASCVPIKYNDKLIHLRRSLVNPYKVDIQSAYPRPLPFPKLTIKTWARLAIQNLPAAELTLRFVSNDEIQTLNHQYRHKNKPTNVLAFPSAIPSHIKQTRPFLGDLVIAPDVLQAEHETLAKPLDAHWAHIIIHGVLHLLGHTHEEAVPTQRMQTLETQYLAQLNFPDPYGEHLE
jgi:probable rRNA maturation factor